MIDGSGRVLVLDASRRAALSIIRSLGRKGIRVTAADSRLASSGFLSRYAREKVVYPPAERNVEIFRDFLFAHLRAARYDVLFPVHDFDLVPIAEERDRFLSVVRVVLPPQDALYTVLDKVSTVNLARRLGVPVPLTFVVNDIGELDSLAEGLSYPVVIKPRRQVVWNENKAATLTLVGGQNYISSKNQFRRAYEAIHKQSPYPIVQERVSGIGAGVAVLFRDGRPRVLFSYRRIREYPITGGPSTLRESTEEPSLKDHAERLLRALRWNGVAMVEFKVDENSGQAWLIEINGRFWGSLALPIAAGVDFPYLVYQLAMEGDVPAVTNYKVGVRARWLVPGDLLWLASSIRNNPRSTRKVVRDFMRSPRVHYDYECWDDPLPALGTLVTSLGDGIDVLRRRRSLLGEYRRGEEVGRR